MELFGNADQARREHAMTHTNRELFERDPTTNSIPNDGVAQVVRPDTAQQWDVLEWELRNFVCDGEYTRGLDRILGSFLASVNKPQQPAVWVSGFYGSGKSHLVRVLEYLWRDVELPSGERARSLVRLPNEVRDHLTELSTAGRRAGGLWSAAGTLAAGRSDTVRLAFLSVLFENAGLPQQYPHARFMIWAREHGHREALSAAAAAAGKSIEAEVHDLYVSPVIARALLEADPSLGDSVKDVRELLVQQFPPAMQDIGDDDMFAVMEKVLRLQSSSGTELPLTLVILDEMQQYIGEDNEKALAVQNIVEGCAARFQSQVLFVATGQSALTATPTLQKLTDRFAVQVALSDKDVESVVREVILRKRPEQVGSLKAKLESVSGEIDRHLGGTQFAPRAADKQDLVADYPMIPTRRRFWEVGLRAIDRAGQAGVLRTQLKIVHEAARQVAGQEIGHVVGGDFIFDQQAAGMLQSGVLLKEIDERIRGLRDESGDGLLKSRICALIFLIAQLPRRPTGAATGLRATAPFIADLLVEDLAVDGSTLRKRVPELLEALEAEGALMRIDDEYQLQTDEGVVWETDYRRRLAVIGDDAGRMSELRGEQLAAALDRKLGGLKLTHGTSRLPRKIGLYWGGDPPVSAEGEVPIWISDEWSLSESALRKAAAEAGEESPIVFVFLPKLQADQIKEALAGHAAANEAVDQNPTPQTDEGRAAQKAMQTKAAAAEEQLKRLFDDIVAHARVYQGGGGEVTTSLFQDAVMTAARRSLVRLFPQFAPGDRPVAQWAKVISRTRDGDPDPLEAVGYKGKADAQPVCKEVLAAVSAGGTKGVEVHRHFGAPPFGWPRDAVNAAVFVLLAAGNIRAAQDGQDVSAKSLTPSQVGKVTLSKEDEPPAVAQRLAVKGLLAAAGIPYEEGKEVVQIPALLQRLKELAERAGGQQPLPEPPDRAHVDALSALGGNRQFRAVADERERLSQDLERWRAAEERRGGREAEWGDLGRLLRHAEGLAAAERVERASAAIHEGRQLLDDPDPLRPLLDELTGALRKELKQLIQQHADAQRAAVGELESWGEWGKLAPGDAQGIIADTQLAVSTAPRIGSDAELLQALDTLPLSGWRDRIGLVPSRRDQARQRAAKLLEPASVTVTPSPATLKTPDDLEAYLVALRARVLPYLKDKKTVII
jgi:hypothetical protein